MSRWSWILAVLGLVASIIAVQFDEPWLEIGGATGFALMFAWLFVAMRARARPVP